MKHSPPWRFYHTGRQQGSWKRNQRKRRRLFLESLEARQVLSVIVEGLPDWQDLGSKPMISAGSNSDPDNPASGAVEAVAVDPNDPSHIFVASVNGGIWRTHNGNDPFDGEDDDGVNGVDDPLEQPDWEPLTDEFPSLAMGDIRFSPLDPTGNTVFAGSGSFSSLGSSGGLAIGIFRTTDDGETWNVFPLDPGGTEFQVRAVLPTAVDLDPGAGVQQMVLVGTTGGGGLYRSDDNGETYDFVSGSNGLPTGEVTQLIPDPNNDNRFFAAVANQGIFQGDFDSGDSSLDWTPFNTNIPAAAISRAGNIQIAAFPGNPTILFALLSGELPDDGDPDEDPEPAPTAFRWTSGTDWVALATPPDMFSRNNRTRAGNTMVVDPTDDDVAYITTYGGGDDIFRYNPAGGGSWDAIVGGGAAGNTRPHADGRDLEFADDNILIDTNDGGIYFLANPQDAGNNRWTSLHGRGATGLGITEYHNAAWDTTFDVAVGGAQDNGSSVQDGTGNVIWDNFRGKDGGDIQIDTVNAGAGQVFRYTGTQDFELTRHTFDSATNQPVGAVSLDPGGLPGFDSPFVPRFELNAINPARLVTGGGGDNPVYELLNAATAPDAANADWQAVPVEEGFGSAAALAYGGRLGGVDNEEVLVVGSGGDVYVRSMAGGTLTVTPTAFPGGNVVDIVLAPEDWQHFFVADGSGVWETTNAGVSWNDLTRNMGQVNTRLQSLEFIPTDVGGVVVVGGNLGVSRLPLYPADASWTRLGAGLPNALAQDLDYDPVDDVLLVAEFGRGVWLVEDASVVAQNGAVLNVCGDEDHTNQDDVIRLVRDAINPLILNVFVNNPGPVPTFSIALAILEQINVFGVGGNDELIVDSTGGLINVPLGIRYDGDGACPGTIFGAGYDRGVDQLTLVQTGGPIHDSDTYSVGPDIGAGSSVIVGAGVGNVQTIYFEELEPVIDLVPAALLTVNGTVAANAINYSQGSLLANGLVTVDNFESIEFSNKTALQINALAGNDVVNLNNAATPTGLVNITVNGGDGDDELTTRSGVSVAVNMNGGAGHDLLDASGVSGGPGTLDGGDGDDVILGGSGVDTYVGGTGDDALVISLGADTLDGGSGFDTVLLRGTPGNDVLSANQSAATTLVTTLNGASVTDTLITSGGVRTIERVRIEAGSGDDVIFVTHADGLGLDGSVNAVLFDVDGGGAQTRDRLSVQDNGTGDLVLYRKGENDSEGSVTVGPGNAEPLETVFTGVETVQPIAAAGGQLIVFKHDGNENNDERINATHLGAGDTINLDPTIDPGALAVVPPGFAPLPGDQDFYRVVAEKTGTLDFQVYFTAIASVASGRPGLPGNGNLWLELYDADGTLIVDGVAGGVVPEFGINDNTSDQRIRIPAVQGQSYFLRVFGATGAAINNYSVTIINDAGPTPYALELDDQPVGDPPPANSDTGRSQFDNITRDNTPTLVLRLDDGFFVQDLPGNSVPGAPPDEVIPIPFRAGPAQPILPGYAIAIFDEGPNPNPGGTAPQVPLGFATQTSPGVYEFTTPVLLDGSHFLSARVQLIDPANPQQTGFTARSERLEIVVDTVIPPVSFGQPGDPDDGVISDSDTGVNPTNPDTLIDLVTRDTTPTFWGRAEANTIIRIYADVNGNGTLEIGTDVFLGQDTAIPLDGTNQEPDGFWKIESIVHLNDPDFFPDPDGQRTIFVTAEDVAGNVNASGPGAADTLEIFIDTQGPQITDVEINEQGNPYSLFDPKPSTDGPTPLVASLVISIQDLPPRTLDFLVDAIKDDIADNPGHYRLTGDYNGIIPIQDVIVTLIAPQDGQPALATIELVFWDFGADATPFTLDDIGGPLPDDRYTLFVSEDGIIDRAGNILDGESNAAEPHNQDSPFPDILGVSGVPTGDGLPGGDFLARFTIDSVAEVGTWGAGSAWIDTNANTSFDPANPDFTNRDITYILGLSSDDLFAGNFAALVDDPNTPADDTIADGFDKLAAYGRLAGVWRWLIDTDNDGVPNISLPEPAGVNGRPVAGNFDGDATNGDEVGVFTGTTWWLDTDHDFQLDTSIPAGAGFIGQPVVGDFDGDGLDDLGAWADDVFKFDLAADLLDGQVDAQFRFGFSNPNERPVAADVNGDGIDDIGLYVPNRGGVSPDETAEWYILVSGEVKNNGDIPPGFIVAPDTLGPSIIDRIVLDPLTGQPIIRFTPKPFGRDVFVQYGDEFGLPILGNFDPPVTGGTINATDGYNFRDPLDVNNDGKISVFDAALIINHMNLHGPSAAVSQSAFPKAPFLDVTNNGRVSASDAIAVINYLNWKVSQPSGAEGEADAYFSEVGQSGSTSDSSDLLALIADDLETQRKRRE